MKGHDAPGDPQSPRSRDDLVFALCHEIGNLLAAARLEAALLDHTAGPDALRLASHRLSAVAARSGSLLALVRPLWVPERILRTRAEPCDLLAGLRRGLDASCDERVAIDVASAANLGGIECATEVLHHLLLTAIFIGLEAGDAARSPVRVAACAAGSDVEIFVENEGVAEDEEAGALRGRSLAVAVARRLLASQGARVALSHTGVRTRVAFLYPCVRS